MELNKAIERVEKWNRENRFRDAGELNSAIDTVLFEASKVGKLKNRIKEDIAWCEDLLTNKIFDKMYKIDKEKIKMLKLYQFEYVRILEEDEISMEAERC